MKLTCPHCGSLIKGTEVIKISPGTALRRAFAAVAGEKQVRRSSSQILKGGRKAYRVTVRLDGFLRERIGAQPAWNPKDNRASLDYGEKCATAQDQLLQEIGAQMSAEGFNGLLEVSQGGISYRFVMDASE